ncbi:hypothetical protein J6590_027041 [Homalodisca vitripennis]|nr:hypothetical protein J6590_027041 [Homalodisca vitripennis]
MPVHRLTYRPGEIAPNRCQCPGRLWYSGQTPTCTSIARCQRYSRVNKSPAGPRGWTFVRGRGGAAQSNKCLCVQQSNNGKDRIDLIKTNNEAPRPARRRSLEKSQI